MWKQNVEKAALYIRKLVLELTIERNGCYLSQGLSSADILATLYLKVLNLGSSTAPSIAPSFQGVPGSKEPHLFSGGDYHGKSNKDVDRFLISPAHYGVAIYAALVAVGRLDRKSFKTFNIDGSTMEMIGAEHSPGFELTTGSFGQAISQAGGIAFAKRLKKEKGRIFVFMSDGELEEGQTWEGIQALSQFQLDNVIVYVDVNGQQVDGLTKDIMNIEPIDERIRAFGGNAIKVDGHNIQELADAVEQYKPNGKPLFVLCYTNTSQGVPLLDSRKPNLHFVRFTNDAEIQQYKYFLEKM